MSSLIMWIAALIAVSTAAGKLVSARRQLTAGTVYLAGALGTIGVSCGLAAPASLTALATVAPFPGAARVAANVLALVAAFCVYGMLAHLVYTPATARSKVRVQALVLTAAGVALTILRMHAPVTANPQYMGAYADEPAGATYVVVFTGHIAVNAAAFVGLIHRYRRYLDRPWLRAGLAVMQAGAASAVAWAGVKITAAVHMLLAGRPLGVPSSVASALPALCITLVALGTAIPTVGPLAVLPLRWLRMYRHYRRLAPLWNRVTQAVPEVTSTVTEVPPRRTDVPTRLTRRVVEIRDGLLFLAPYRDAAVARAADQAAGRHGLTGELRDALITAAEVTASANARRTDQPPHEDAPAPPRRQPDTFRDELAWLTAIADHCHHPAVLTATSHTAPKDTRDAHA